MISGWKKRFNHTSPNVKNHLNLSLKLTEIIPKRYKDLKAENDFFLLKWQPKKFQ